MNDAVTEFGIALSAADPLSVVTSDGRHVPLDVRRWHAPVDAADESVLAACRPPVLDVGCGPGRFVGELSARGIPALGVDIAAPAVALTRRKGAPAVLRNAFAPLPGEGRWPTILLMDGNVGIGGDPARLLRRLASALAAQGRLIVEADAGHRGAETARRPAAVDGVGRWRALRVGSCRCARAAPSRRNGPGLCRGRVDVAGAHLRDAQPRSRIA